MKKICYVSATILGLAWRGLAAETVVPTNATAAALAKSDFVFLCTVKAEGTTGHTPRGYFKSYLVTYPEVLHFGLEGLELPGEIWIYYDSSEYPDVPRSGHELTFHKGDTFIAFLDYFEGVQRAFHVVRIDKTDAKEDIKNGMRRAPNRVPVTD